MAIIPPKDSVYTSHKRKRTELALDVTSSIPLAAEVHCESFASIPDDAGSNREDGSPRSKIVGGLQKISLGQGDAAHSERRMTADRPRKRIVHTISQIRSNNTHFGDEIVVKCFTIIRQTHNALGKQCNVFHIG